MRIARELKGLYAMRFKIMAAPDVVHRRLAHPQALGQQAAAPLGSTLGFGLQGGVDDFFDFLLAIGGFASSTRSNLPQTLQPLLGNASPPEHHGFAIDL